MIKPGHRPALVLQGYFRFERAAMRSAAVQDRHDHG
jgi:hypothetical protein